MNLVHMLESFNFRNHVCMTFELLSMNLYELIKKNRFQVINENNQNFFRKYLKKASKKFPKVN